MPVFQPRNFNKTGPGDEARAEGVQRLKSDEMLDLGKAPHPIGVREADLLYRVITCDLICKLKNIYTRYK